MIDTVRAAIIPKLNAFCGVPVIEADQTGDKPTGPHATFKFTSQYIKDNGQAEETATQTATTYQLKRVEQHKIAISITAIDEQIDGSTTLAQKLNDWFEFFGVEDLQVANIVVVEKTAIQNRDTFLIDEYERRNGFDVIVRVTKELTKDIPYIETVNGITD